MERAKLHDVDIDEEPVSANAPSILRTEGLAHCISVGIYTPNGTGQLCHYSNGKDAFDFLNKTTQEQRAHTVFLAGGYTAVNLPPKDVEETRSWLERIRELAGERCVNMVDKLDTFETCSIEMDLGERSTATIWGFVDSNYYKSNKPHAVFTYNLSTTRQPSEV